MRRINRRARGARRVFLFAAALRPGGLALHALERAPVRQVLDQATRDASLGNDGGERMLLVAALGTALAGGVFLSHPGHGVGWVGGVAGAAGSSAPVSGGLLPQPAV